VGSWEPGPSAITRQRGWFLDDVRPGLVLRHPGARTIGPDEQVLLAWWTNNAGDLHGDAARAARGPFGGPVVLGALTVAIVAGLAGPAVPDPEDLPDDVGIGWDRIRLVRRVLPGDTIRAESAIHEVHPDGSGRGGIVRRTVTGFDQGGLPVVVLDERIWSPRQREQRIVDRG
jgi:acyl dehydratase